MIKKSPEYGEFIKEITDEAKKFIADK